MNTTEDFENAPVGATATNDLGHRALKTVDLTLPWSNSQDNYLRNTNMADEGYTLDPSAPTTAREALDLAWELAHEVKEGQIIPKGTRYLAFTSPGLREYTACVDRKIGPELAPVFRTLEPLPDPEPDWLDAPAVLAKLGKWGRDGQEVFIPAGEEEEEEGNWVAMFSALAHHWSELVDVTPLYPKEGQEA